MAEIADQAVAEVDRTAGHTAQRLAERNARRRTFHAHPHGVEGLAGQYESAAKDFERQPRIAQPSARWMADPQAVARPCTRTQQRLAHRHGTEHGDADVQRPGRGVAAHQLDALRIGQREHPARKAFEKGCIDARHRQRQREGDRLGAAGRQVGQVHGQGLVAEPLGRHGGQEMPALDQHVARHCELLAGRQRRQQRAVVADAQRGMARRAREVARDQIEFAERRGHAFSSQ